MRVWQANLGRGVSSAEFERNLSELLEHAGRRAVVALQEIDEADAPDELAILERLIAGTWRIVGAGTMVPILVPLGLEVLEQRRTLGSRGLARFTPHRPVNEVVLELPSGLEVAILNGHVPIDRPETRSRRRAMRRTLRRRARAHRHRAGVWLADTNTSRRRWPTILRGERSVIETRIDRAKAWAPRGRRVIVLGRWHLELTIDGHDAHGVRVWWPRVKRR